MSFLVQQNLLLLCISVILFVCCCSYTIDYFLKIAVAFFWNQKLETKSHFYIKEHGASFFITFGSFGWYTVYIWNDLNSTARAMRSFLKVCKCYNHLKLRAPCSGSSKPNVPGGWGGRPACFRGGTEKHEGQRIQTY